MNKITLIFPYYKNPKMLEYQLGVWKSYPPQVLSNLEIIVVDDCSPIGLRAEEVVARIGKPACAFKLMRILTDVAWNECGAKNLGALSASSEWLLITDIDHIVTEKILSFVQSMKLDHKTIYSFTRIRHLSNEANNPHKETMLINIVNFFKIGMFNEAYCGHYSFCVREFFERPAYLEAKKYQIKIPLERVDDVIIPDAKVFGLIRKEGRDDEAYEDIRKWIDGKRIETLKLPWKEIAI